MSTTTFIVNQSIIDEYNAANPDTSKYKSISKIVFELDDALGGLSASNYGGYVEHVGGEQLPFTAVFGSGAIVRSGDTLLADNSIGGNGSFIGFRFGASQSGTVAFAEGGNNNDKPGEMDIIIGGEWASDNTKHSYVYSAGVITNSFASAPVNPTVFENGELIDGRTQYIWMAEGSWKYLIYRFTLAQETTFNQFTFQMTYHNTNNASYGVNPNIRMWIQASSSSTPYAGTGPTLATMSNLYPASVGARRTSQNTALASDIVVAPTKDANGVLSTITLPAGTYTMTFQFTAGTSGDLIRLFSGGASGTAHQYESVNFQGVYTNLASLGSTTPYVALDYIAPAYQPLSDVTLSASSVPENVSLGTVVGSLSAVDGLAPHTFALSGGLADNAAFSIVGSDLVVNAPLDFESKSSYSIEVSATDADSNVFAKQLSVSVTNANETPFGLSLSSLQIVENNSVGAVIGTLSATDPDGDALSFSITGGADAASFSVSGNQLLAAEAFDYETKQSYEVQVRASDAQGLYVEGIFNISVLNSTSDDPVEISGGSGEVVLSSGKSVVSVSADPTQIEVLKDGQPLPVGSVVRNTVTGQKFIKIAGSSTSFDAIELVPKAEWSWSADGEAAWEVLQGF